MAHNNNSKEMEDLHLGPVQQAAYDQAQSLLKELETVETTEDLGVTPSVVSLQEEAVEDDAKRSGTLPAQQQLLTSIHGNHVLSKALDELEGLQKTESVLYESQPLTRLLTECILPALEAAAAAGGGGMDTTSAAPAHYSSTQEALQALARMGQAVPRRVCQHPFKRNDIVWVCRTCQADETCVLCHNCFSQSNHDGHDVAFYHAQAGGCCDCGDPDAWDPAGFCPHHGPVSGGSDEASSALPPNVVQRVSGVVPAAVDWLVQVIAQNAQVAYARAHPQVPRELRKLPSSASAPGETGSLAATATEGRAAPPGRSVSALGTGMEIDYELHGGASDDDDSFDDDDSMFRSTHAWNVVTRAHVFSPTAAGSGKEEREELLKLRQDEHAAEIGTAGSAGQGLFLVLHADDIHSTSEQISALRSFLGSSTYYTDSLLGKLVRTLHQYGELVLWGTREMANECGETQVQLWKDGDKVASAKIGAELLQRASRLTRHGLFCSIVTRRELMLEQRAVTLLQWLSAVACSCDPLCQTVAECILPNRHLVPLLRADFKMSSRVTKAWYSLLLTLLAVPTFKSHLAAAYVDTYRNVTAKYARGMGVLDNSGYHLSVQFLNRETYVVDLVQNRDLMGKLGKTLLETFLVASRNQHLNGRLDPNHFVLGHRRYSPCISDFKCVLNVQGMPRLVACKGATFLGDWIAVLSLAQFMDPQTWRHWAQGHVEEESRGWVCAFNTSISLCSLFERLLGWKDAETSPIKDPSSPLSKDLMSCADMTCHILVTGVAPWQKSEEIFYEPSPFASAVEPHKRCPASLPFSTVAARHGSALAMRQLPVSQTTPFSFHLPLHRFVSGCLRELTLRHNDEEDGVAGLLQRLRTQLNAKEIDDLFRCLMEFPVLTLSRAAQVRAGLWRRSGPGIVDQVLNYSEPPFCRSMRDSDLLMIQFAVLGRVAHLSPQTKPPSDVGLAFFVNLMLHRLGIFDFVGFAKAPNSDINRYVDEVAKGLYPRERNASDSPDDLALPWTYSPARDVAPSLVLVEEFLHTMIIFAVELPPVTPADDNEHTAQAKTRLHSEIVHRLASGPKQHSELSEVHHVLSHWDSLLLSEEGKKVNPDDATGAALATILNEVADKKVSRGKMEPDRWEIKSSSWESYDPSFFHISLRNHQSAAEMRPKASADASAPFGWKSRPYAPRPQPAHVLFRRLRRDVTADATVIAVAYRVLHTLCRANSEKDLSNLRGKAVYESNEKSETALARSVHLFTLGAYAWEAAVGPNGHWQENGGGSVGSIFFERSIDGGPAPTVSDWISGALLASPGELLDCDWYNDEECALLLLKRLAVDGGTPGGFTAQDLSVRAGAAWLCEFAVKHNAKAAELIGPSKVVSEAAKEEVAETEIQKRKRLAQEKAKAMMKAQAMKFANMMDVELDESEDDTVRSTREESLPSTPQRRGREITLQSPASSIASAPEIETGGLVLPESNIPPRLLKARPRCIICNDEDSPEVRASENDSGEGQRKKSRKKSETALGFVSYVQASTVLNGGGEPPQEPDSATSPAREFVGAYVSLCGHAVHSECCESYLATVSHREDRTLGKRDEFRCPLCQRLSNCLIPFIDVGVDWIDSLCVSGDTLVCSPVAGGKAGNDAKPEAPVDDGHPVALGVYLSKTPWWLAHHSNKLTWDGQSAFIDSSGPSVPEVTAEADPSTKPIRRRSVRSLKKKDVYAAWNAMMRTPRIVRKRLRSRGASFSDSRKSPGRSEDFAMSVEPESTGETVVWRRFMDQISDVTYRGDSKRLGDDRLHDCFGEFRHYIAEKYAYNIANRASGSETVDWPSCMFTEQLSDSRKQEMSREKLLSKLLLSVQAFTYSCVSEAFEARRLFRRAQSSSNKTAGMSPDSTIEAVLSKFGIADVVCGGNVLLMPQPSSEEDDGSQPFNGRLGRLRYLGLAVMAAAGAVAADLVQIVLPFPLRGSQADPSAAQSDAMPVRAPIAYPVLFGNVLTHVVAAMCAACGRGRARSDSLDLVWSSPFTRHGSFVFDKDPEAETHGCTVVEDCEGFLRLGLLARILQVLLGRMEAQCGFDSPQRVIDAIKGSMPSLEREASPEQCSWLRCCLRLLEIAVTNEAEANLETHSAADVEAVGKFKEASVLAASAACSFLCDAGTIMQILVPGIMSRYDMAYTSTDRPVDTSPYGEFEKLRYCLKIESMEEMLESPLAHEIVSNWYDSARRFVQEAVRVDGRSAIVRKRLFRTPGVRVFDWSSDFSGLKIVSSEKKSTDVAATDPSQNTGPESMQVDSVGSESRMATQETPPLVTFSSKKTVPLFGSFVLNGKGSDRPRVAVIPTSYTDLYAELGTLMPDCEQTAVCLVCGEVLNASGKGECTRHSYKCGAGAGLFFLLQECSGLIMHKSKAAYMHSPYVDSHGETPQYRGRPLNLDLDRYEHLRELWYGHSVRQQVIAERGSSRQVILPDFY